MKTINKLLLTGTLFTSLNSQPVYSNENVLYLNQIHKDDKINVNYHKKGKVEKDSAAKVLWIIIGGTLLGAAGGYCLGHSIGRIKGWDDCLQRYGIKKEEKLK